MRAARPREGRIAATAMARKAVIASNPLTPRTIRYPRRLHRIAGDAPLPENHGTGILAEAGIQHDIEPTNLLGIRKHWGASELTGCGQIMWLHQSGIDSGYARMFSMVRNASTVSIMRTTMTFWFASLA